MTSPINIDGVAKRSGRRTRRIAKSNRGERWQSADAARFLFKGQCYDAGSRIFRACDLCGEPIRLVYVLKLIESPSHPCSPEIDKLDVGECCFGKIEAANGKLYGQLLAAAVNLRTYMEAIERDRRVFVGRQEAGESEIVEMLQLRRPGLEED
ncbi:MAG: hypothetical protein ACLPLZ_05615 [Terracidiphilus sp.]